MTAAPPARAASIEWIAARCFDQVGREPALALPVLGQRAPVAPRHTFGAWPASRSITKNGPSNGVSSDGSKPWTAGVGAVRRRAARRCGTPDRGRCRGSTRSAARARCRRAPRPMRDAPARRGVARPSALELLEIGHAVALGRRPGAAHRRQQRVGLRGIDRCVAGRHCGSAASAATSRSIISASTRCTRAPVASQGGSAGRRSPSASPSSGPLATAAIRSRAACASDRESPSSAAARAPCVQESRSAAAACFLAASSRRHAVGRERLAALVLLRAHPERPPRSAHPSDADQGLIGSQRVEHGQRIKRVANVEGHCRMR